MTTVKTYEIAGVYNKPTRIRIVSDCCGFHAVAEVCPFGKWTFWNETRSYKTESGARKGMAALLKRHRIEFAFAY